MKATFDQSHQMRIIKVEAGPEFDTCVDVAKVIDEMPEAPEYAQSVASFLIYLGAEGTNNIPPLCGHDADGLIISLDLARQRAKVEADAMKIRSLLEQVQAGVDIAPVLAA